MEDIFKIKLSDLKENKLNLQEYLTLRYLYHKKHGDWELLIESFGPISSIFMNSLESKGFIKICKDVGDCSNASEFFELREKANVLFEETTDYFLTWLGTFPIKTPSGRYLSTSSDDTIMGKKLRKKWKALFKNNSLQMAHAIEVLEAEMDWRRRNGKFEFMHNAETWLNQGDFEKYEYLLSDKKTEINKARRDYE